MRIRRVVVALAVSVTLGSAGIAVVGPESASASVVAAPRCARTAAADGAITLRNRDDGRTVCVAPGDVVTVFLQAPVPARPWAAISSSDAAVLAVRPSGRLALPIGVTGGVFGAAAPGRARLTSVRPPCAPGEWNRCNAAHRWSVRVVSAG